MQLKSNFSLNQAWPQLYGCVSLVLIHFPRTVMVVVGSPTTDLLAFVDCLFSGETVNVHFPNADRNMANLIVRLEVRISSVRNERCQAKQDS